MTIKFKFIDSFSFLSELLDKLVQYCNEFKIIKDMYPHQYSLLTRKGVFPYEYVDDYVTYGKYAA